jgi:hypothetical protein
MLVLETCDLRCGLTGARRYLNDAVPSLRAPGEFFWYPFLRWAESVTNLIALHW